MNSKWKCVLVEWINCLKMGRPIEDLESLLDGEFLINFMNALIKRQLAMPNIIPQIRDFIKTEYPSFNFNLSLSTDNIVDLSSQELTPLLSILMHHSCIVNQRDNFTSPMCYHISKESQIYIKRFLEEINSSNGDVNLNEIIGKCLKIEESSSITHWISSAGDSPMCSTTPLKDYLKTPFKTRFLTEQEHEIKKLRNCLELESFEKTDLVDELNGHKNNIEHLKQQLKWKSQEVFKLRNELFEAERSVSPRSVTKKYDLNRQLRSEITDLEKYVNQLQKEQEELQDEKDISNRKLNKAETELKTANEKVFSLEVVCDQLTDKHKEQRQELETLRLNCSELNLLLSELRGLNQNNSSFLDASIDNILSTSNKRRSSNLNDTASCEDLACSVIEVQLRDAQEENNNLKQELNKSVEVNKEISSEIDKLKAAYETLQNNFETSEEDKSKLNGKLDEFEKSLDELQFARQELLEHFNSTNQEKSQLSCEVQRLNKANEDIFVQLQQSASDVFALQSKLNETGTVHEISKRHLAQLADEALHLQSNLDQKITDLSQANYKINSLEQAFESLDSKFDANLKKLEQMIRGKIQKDCYENKCAVFEELLLEFEDKQNKAFENNEVLRAKLIDFELDVDTLENKLDELKLKELADFEFSRKLQEKLKEAELKHEVLEQSINEKDGAIKKLTQYLDEMENTVEGLNSLKIKYENELLLRESSLLNFLRDLKNVNKILESRTLLPFSGEVIEDFTPECQNLLEGNESLKLIKESWTENEKKYLIEAFKVNENIAAIIIELESRNLELEACTNNSKLKSLQLEDVQMKYMEVQKELETTKIDFEVKIKLLEEAKYAIKKELYERSQKCIIKCQELDEQAKKFKTLTKEKEEYLNKSEALKDDIKTLAEKLIVSEKVCEQKDDILAKSSQELLNNKLELESKKQVMSEMKDELSNLYSEINVVKTEMVQLNEENEAHRIKVGLLEKEMDFLEGLKEDLAKKNRDLEANNIRVIQQLSVKNKEYNDCIEDIKNCKQKKEQVILNLKQRLEENNAEILELNLKFDNASAKYGRETKDLNQEMVKLLEQISNFEIKEKDYLGDIKKIKGNLVKLVKTCYNLAKKNNLADSRLNILQSKEDDLIMEDFEPVFNALLDLQNETNLNSEEAKAEKIKVEEILTNKEFIIAAMTTKLSSTQNSFELAKNQLADIENQLSEKVYDLTKVSTEKSSMSIKLLELENAIEKSKRERDALLDSRRKILEDTEVNIKSAHESAIQLKRDLEERLDIAQNDILDSKKIQREIEIALNQEKAAKEALQLRILDLENERVQLMQVKYRFSSFIMKINENFEENVDFTDDCLILEELSNKIELQIVDVIHSKNELAHSLKVLKEDEKSMRNKVCTLEEIQSELAKEKEELLEQFEHIQLKRSVQNQKNYEALSIDYELLKAKYEQYKEYCRNNEKTNLDKLQKLSNSSKAISDNYDKIKQNYHVYKLEIEALVKERNSAETLVNNLSEKLSVLRAKSSFINEDSYKSLFEKKMALEVINSDLQKQFLRCSKITSNNCFHLLNIFDAAMQKIIAGQIYEQFDPGNLKETKQKLEEIKEFAEDAILRVNNFVVPPEKVSANILKESNSQSAPNKELEDLRKKFNALKQKLILAENTKCNYARKIQILREDNNKLTGQNKRPTEENMDSEKHYKTLLQQHLQTKEEHETLITECEAKYKQLLREFENYKKDHPELSTNIQHLNNNKTLQDRSIKLEKEVHKLRDAYGNLMSDKSKLELENLTIKKVMDDRNVQIADLTLIKEAYEKLLEDGNKLLTDIDTLQYKRTRDREEFVRILKNEKDEYENREGKRVQDIRNEYELKLEKMKDKMVKLYKEEVDKEMQKVFSEKSNNTTLMEAIEHLRDELTDTQLKLQLVENERSSALNHLHQAQRQITHQHHHRISVQPSIYRDNLLDSLSSHLLGNSRESSSMLLRSDTRLNGGGGVEVLVEDRRCTTLPRANGAGGAAMDVLEEIRIQKRTSISGHLPSTTNSDQLEMEDEDDMFNNKYLADLKDGRCNPALTNTEPTGSTRLTELAYRNSMCLPHLKSSYPCETQFASPSVFKEEHIKLGSNTTSAVTQQSHLPPPHPHQHRLRKDAGTTSYKRPGPPTPSKNGGRASLSSMDRAQGAVLPLREVNDGRASIATSVVQQARNKLTPTRLRALFASKGKNTTVENQGSPKGKRLSIFKKPR